MFPRKRRERVRRDHGRYFPSSAHSSCSTSLAPSSFIYIMDNLVFSQPKTCTMAIISTEAGSSRLECPNTRMCTPTQCVFVLGLFWYYSNTEWGLCPPEPHHLLQGAPRFVSVLWTWWNCSKWGPAPTCQSHWTPWKDARRYREIYTWFTGKRFGCYWLGGVAPIVDPELGCERYLSK